MIPIRHSGSSRPPGPQVRDSRSLGCEGPRYGCSRIGTRRRNHARGGARRGEARRAQHASATSGLGLQDGQHLGIEFMRGEAFREVGIEVVIVDGTVFDNSLPSTVVGQQIAAKGGEMGMVFKVDMHLLPRIGGKQGGEQECCDETFSPEVHLHWTRRYEKKGPRQAVPAKIPNYE